MFLKKIAIIGMLLMLIYSLGGYYFLMINIQRNLKENIKEKIVRKVAEKELDTISFTDNRERIYWETDEDNEFSFNDEMYDVVKTKTVNGKVMLYCINDKKEKDLVDNYNLVTKQNSSSDKKGKNTVDNTFNLFIYQVEQNSVLVTTRDPNYFYSIVPHLTQGIDETLPPPPKA